MDETPRPNANPEGGMLRGWRWPLFIIWAGEFESGDGVTVLWLTSKSATGELAYGRDHGLSEGLEIKNRRRLLQTAHISSLVPGSRYYYRIRAHGSNRAVAVRDDSFTTRPDRRPPEIVNLSAVGGETDEQCVSLVEFAASVEDNRCMSQDDVLVTVTLADGNAELGDPDVQVDVVDGSGVDIEGSVEVTDLFGCDASVEIRISAMDCGGNAAETETIIAQVAELLPPSIDCPADVVVDAEPGAEQASVSIPFPDAADNCTIAGVLNDYNGGPNASGPYPVGTTTVTWTAIDGCGFTAECAMDVTVNYVEPPLALISDDFNGCGIDETLWEIVDPVGDAEISARGVGTENAVVEITLPPGSDHNVWRQGNRAPRLLQQVPDTDFTLEAKFDALMAGAYQMQGMLVEEDPTNFLRFDFYSNNSGMRIFAAFFVNGEPTLVADSPAPNAAPLYMRISREGDVWTQDYSTDGVSWTTHVSFTHAMTAVAAGPFVGNVGLGFTGRIDYFFDADDPIVPEDGPLGEPGAVLDVQIVGAGQVDVDPDDDVYYCGETVTLTALPDLGWMLDSWSGDLTGAELQETLSMEVSRDVTATFVVDPRPLEITGISVEPGPTSAVVSWTTNKTTLGSVAYGTSTAYDMGDVESAEAALEHSVVLTGLTPRTDYHFEILADDGIQQLASGDQTFQSARPGAVDSDDFNAFNLKDVWSVYNPLGDATFTLAETNTPNAHLAITVPHGVEHFIGPDQITAPHLLQPADNKDFVIQLKYESQISERFQEQGILIKQNENTYLRCDVYSNGIAPHIFVARYANGAVQTIQNMQVPMGFPWFIRVTRTGDHWLAEYSFNGVNWEWVAEFDYAMIVNDAGPFIGNEGGPAPAFTGILDYFFDMAEPIVPEDGEEVEDTTPPAIIELNTSAADNRIILRWTTDEPASYLADYGTSTAYETGTVEDEAMRIDHTAVIEGLTPETTYHIRITSTDAFDNVGQSEDIAVTTLEEGASAGPPIEVWYGSSQEFGQVGKPQPWVNVLGKVLDAGDLESVTYSLNGGPNLPLSVGPDSYRLAKEGDFNVELDFDELEPGSNQILIRATDSFENETVMPVEVINSVGPAWPESYTVDWSTTDQINDVAQVVDGKWTIEGGTVRPVELGYDRLIALGDVDWTDYEVSAPITVYSLDPAGYAPPSNGPGVGLCVRWPGHGYLWGNEQPRTDPFPLGAIAFFRWQTQSERFLIYGNNGFTLDAAPASETLVFGVEYMFKIRVQSTSVGATYKMKYWQADQQEPVDWQLIGHQSEANDPGHGSILLVAHHCDATFGAVTVSPGPFADDPLALSNVQVTSGDTFAEITWDTNYDAGSEVLYGLTPAYEIGTESDPTPVSNHSITLTGLEPGTIYHFAVRSEKDGEVVTSGNFAFSTLSEGNPGPSDIVSDDFNDPQLDPQVWTFVDALGNSSYALTGSGTGDAHLEIHVPGGVPHDVSADSNDAARVMQQVSDTDFEVEAKFDSPLNSRFQVQGILVEQNAGSYARFDFVHNGAGVTVYCATYVAGSANVRINQLIPSADTMYLRVNRSGGTWTVQYSLDGSNWTTAVTFSHGMVVNAVGVFAANDGVPPSTTPEHTAKVDYFFNTAAPAVPEDG